MRSAQPYPPLTAGRRIEAAGKTAPSAPQGHCAPARKPLTGYVVLDLANVIAGPACGRLLGELGATVLKMDTTRPDHQPLVTVVWGAEANQGKKSILADLRTIEGRQILAMLVGKADIVVMNATDSGVRRLGLTAEQLHEINPRAIGVQISAFKGAHPSSHFDRPGYDPLLQAATGIMTRFGSHDMPLLHGIASCVDYLTGYLGAFAAVTALQARERRGDNRGDWVDTSLASAAALTQLSFQYKPAPATATGPAATNRGVEDLCAADGARRGPADGRDPRHLVSHPAQRHLRFIGGIFGPVMLIWFIVAGISPRRLWESSGRPPSSRRSARCPP